MAARASEVWAAAHGMVCEGPEKCHYCGAACDRTLPHKEPATPHGHRPRPRPEFTSPLFPGSQFMCRGCAVWRRKRITAPFMGGVPQDGTEARYHSWYVTPGNAWTLNKKSGVLLYERLLLPPCKFFLALLEGQDVPDNLLQHAKANDNAVVEATTKLLLTVNNVPYQFSVYQLQQAVRGPDGLEPGVQALVRMFGTPPASLVPATEISEEEKIKKAGRPPAADPREKLPREVVRRSGDGVRL